MAQVDENLRSAEASCIRGFSAREHDVIAQVGDLYRARTAVPCTKCGYCMPCPNGVNIPGNFEQFNYAHLYGDVADARFKDQLRISPGQRAINCQECTTCEELCPQGIAISQWMPKVAALLA
jgi:hypothetical protein